MQMIDDTGPLDSAEGADTQGSGRRAGKSATVAIAILVVVVIAGVTWARIDGGDNGGASRLSVQKIADATDADTASVLTVTHLGVGETDSIGFEIAGAVDFASHRGDEAITAHGSGLTDGAGHKLSKGPQGETRWIGDDVYSKGGLGGDGFGAEGVHWVLVDGAKVRKASACLEKVDVTAQVAGSEVSDPSRLLDALRERGTGLKRVGRDSIRGVPTTHWQVSPINMPVSRGCDTASSDRHVKVRVDADIWTDSRDRARRVALVEKQTSEFDGQKTSQETTSTTDFFDFGRSVTVERPPPKQVSDNTAGFISLYEGTGVVNDASWHQVAAGSIAGKRWSVIGGRTTTGWYCYDAFDTPRDPGTIGTTYSNGFPKHDGHVTSCVVPDGALQALGTVTLFVNAVDGRQRTIVGVAAGNGTARVIFKDGSMQTLPVAPDSLIFTWKGPEGRKPVQIKAGGQSCRLDDQIASPSQALTLDGMPCVVTAS